MKVFSMNDCDWMAGADLESCKTEYLRSYWHDPPEYAFEDPCELTEEQMNRLKFRGEEGEPCEGGTEEETNEEVSDCNIVMWVHGVREESCS